MIEGSSLRIIVGMYSALGTLEEMSWKGKKEVQQHEEKPVGSGQKHKGHGNSGLFRRSQVLPKLAANPGYLHPSEGPRSFWSTTEHPQACQVPPCVIVSLTHNR